MRIGLVVTGGTLDSSPTPDGLSADSDGGLKAFAHTLLRPGQQLLSIASPWRIDSSQLGSAQILELAKVILSAPAMDAWIIAAGTDTLAWLAPGLWWLLGPMAPPVLLVSGMRPWWHSPSDGADNLRFALNALADGPSSGVWVATANRLLPPYHLRKISHCTIDPFRALPTHGEPLEPLERLLAKIAAGFDIPYIRPPNAPPLKAARSPSVLWIPLHPGMDATTLQDILTSGSIRHLVLSAYSGGTLPHWIFEVIPPTTKVHLTTQQWGPLALSEYAASARLRREAWKCWSLCPETVTSLLSLADLAGMEAEDASIALLTLQTGLFAA